MEKKDIYIKICISQFVCVFVCPIFWPTSRGPREAPRVCMDSLQPNKENEIILNKIKAKR